MACRTVRSINAEKALLAPLSKETTPIGPHFFPALGVREVFHGASQNLFPLHSQEPASRRIGFHIMPLVIGDEHSVQRHLKNRAGHRLERGMTFPSHGGHSIITLWTKS